MTDPVADRLSALGTGPLPLADPATVRERGDRRRRRRQVALACAAVLAAGTLGGGVALVSGSGGQDALRSAAAPTTTPMTSPAPAPSPPVPPCEPSLPPPPDPDEAVVSGGSYEAYCSELTIEFEEPAPGEPEPTAEPALSPPWAVEDALLSPEAAGLVEQPGWAVDRDHQPSRVPLLDPCGDQTFMGDPASMGERAMGSEREAGGSRLVQQVVRYLGETEAAGAYDAFAAKITECPAAPAVEGEGVNRFQVVGSGTADSARTLLVQVQPCGTQGDCTAHFRSYLMLAQAGDGLTLAFYGIGEDGDPEQFAADLLDEVAAQLVRTVRE